MSKLTKQSALDYKRTQEFDNNNDIYNVSNFTRLFNRIKQLTIINPTEKLVFCSILSWKLQGLPCYLTYVQISAECGIDESTVRRSIKSLAAKQFVMLVSNKKGKSFDINHENVHIEIQKQIAILEQTGIEVTSIED